MVLSLLIFLGIACLMPCFTASSALALSNAQMNKLEMAFYRGRLRCFGKADGKPGEIVHLEEGRDMFCWKLVRHLGRSVGKDKKRIS